MYRYAPTQIFWETFSPSLRIPRLCQVGTERWRVRWWGVTCQDEEWRQRDGECGDEVLPSTCQAEEWRWGDRECGDEVLPAKLRSGDRETGSAVMRCYLPSWGVGTERQGVRGWGVTWQDEEWGQKDRECGDRCYLPEDVCAPPRKAEALAHRTRETGSPGRAAPGQRTAAPSSSVLCAAAAVQTKREKIKATMMGQYTLI